MQPSHKPQRSARPFQYGISTILLITFVLMVMVVDETHTHLRSVSGLITIFVIELIVFCVVVEALVRNIPSALVQAQRRNCVRHDGSWSRGRHRRERKSRVRLRREMQKACLLVIVFTNVLMGLLHFEVIPLPLALKAATSVKLSPDEWKSELQEEAREFDKWLSPATANTAKARKQQLWLGWPLLAGAGIAWCLGAGAYIAYAYADALRRLAASINYRAQQYDLQELHASVGRDDFARVEIENSL